MGIEIESISNQIREKLEMMYGVIYDCKVFSDPSSGYIHIKGMAKILDGSYGHFVPGELTLSLEDSKKFLDALDKTIVIYKYLGEDVASLKVTEVNKLVFASKGEKLSSSDILYLYTTLDMQAIKSDLPLCLNMIKLRSVYDDYVDLLEQVNEKRKFLQSYNELITSFDGKKEAIEFAKHHRYNWGRIRGYRSERKYFDISKGGDLVDAFIEDEDIRILSSHVPLENRKSYLVNLDECEIRVGNLIQRLEIEYEKLKKYDMELFPILNEIAESNIITIKPIENVPEGECLDLDTILSEEKDKYKRGLEERKNESQKPKNPYTFIEDLDKQQRKSITWQDKRALMLYKSSMYYLFNQIISYVRSNNISYSELYNDEYVESILQIEYSNYKKRFDDPMILPFLNQSVPTLVDDLLPKSYAVDYSRYRQIAFDYVPLLEKILSRNTLNQPLTVYRCVYEKENADIYSGDLGNALLSTTASVDVVSDFLNDRKPDINFDAQKVIYKINLPAGSPVIAYTDDIFLKYGSLEAGFGDAQKEVLLDSALYDFTYVKCDANFLKDGSLIHTVTLNAVPKYKMGEVKAL